MLFFSYPPTESKIALAKAIVREYPLLRDTGRLNAEGHVSVTQVL